MWDIIQSCSRPGSSLDTNIKNALPNPIYEFCLKHPTIQRIVLVNGSTGGKYFRQFHREWLSSMNDNHHDDDIRAVGTTKLYHQIRLRPYPDHVPSEKLFFKKRVQQRRSRLDTDIDIQQNQKDVQTTTTTSTNTDNNNVNPLPVHSKNDDQESKSESEPEQQQRVITLLSAISVSPAAAMYTYEEKRHFWEQYVFTYM